MQRQGAARSTRFYNRFRTRPLPAPVPSTVPAATTVPTNTTPVRLASTADAAWDERTSKFRSAGHVNKSFDRTLRAPQRPATGSGEPIMPTLSPQTPMLEKESGPESVNANPVSSVGTTNEKGSCGACPDSNIPSVSAGNEMMETESTGGIKTPASAPGPIGIAIDSSPYPPTQTGTNACPTGSSDETKGTNANHAEGEWPPAREGMSNCSMTNGAVLDFDSSTPLSNAETKPAPMGPAHVSSSAPTSTATATVSMSSIGAGGAPLQHHTWDYWSERMHRSWANTANGAASSTTVAASNGCGSVGVHHSGKEPNHVSVNDAVSPGRPALLPGVEDFDDPLQPCRDAGHVRVAGLRRPRIAGSWMEEPESKYFRMGYPLPSPLMTNKRPSTEPAGNSSSNYNWKSEAALRPTEKVPDQIFDCEEDDNDSNVPLLQKQPPDPMPGALHPQLHPQSQEQMAHQPIGHSIASSNGSGPIAAAELARMYPTPPSTEVNHALASPVEAAVGVGALLPHVEVAPKVAALGANAFSSGASNPSNSLAVAHKGKAMPGRVKGVEPNGLVLQPEVDWKFGRPVQGVFVFGVPYSASLGLDTIENSKEELEKGAVTLSYHHRKAGVHPLLQKMDRFSAVQNNSSGNAAGGPLNTGASLNVIGGLGDVPQSPASLPTLPGLGPGHGGGGTPLMGGRYFPGSAPPGNHRVAPLTPGSSYQGTHPSADCASLTSAGASPANAAAATTMRTPRTPGTGGLADYSSPASSGASSSFVGSRPGGLGSVGGGQHSVERPASHPPPPPPTPVVSEVHSLLVNLVLSDSLLNLFKDHNFDSCNICECNSNTKGADVGVYLLDSPLCQSENKRPCTCGFSAVVNKRYAPHSGLFYEDEAELVGIREERPYRSQPPLLRLNENGSMHHLEKPLPEVQNLLYDQVMSCMDVFTTGYMLDWYRHERTRHSFTIRENLHEYRDACEVVRQALDASIIDRHGGANGGAKIDEDSRHLEPLHSWPYLKESQRLPQEEGEALSLLKSIRPWLHQALCDTRILEFTYVVSGPLTWKEFHKLAGRGNEESCEPQPLPQIVVGSDNGASSGSDGGVAIAPYAVQNWEQLALKPFSRQKDVWYLALVPDNAAIFSEVCHFFRELSCVYELCRLGRHVPLPDVVPAEDQGIIRVSERLCSIIDHDSMNPPSPELDQWFAQLNPSHIPSHAEVISKIALYARVCRHFVVNSLKKHGPELVRKAQSAAVAAAATSGSAASYLKGQSTSGSPHATSPPSCGGGGTGSNYSMPPLRSLKPGVKGEPGCLDAESNVGASAAANAFHLVIYLVNPFVYSHDYGDVYRLAMLALMRMVKEIKTQFPPELQNCTTFQMVPLSQITGLSRSTGYDAANNQGAALISVDSWNRPKPNHALTLKAMAFDTYTQLRRIPTVQHFNGNRTLTGFGPTAEREELLRAQPDFSRAQRLVFSPLFTLLPTRDYRSLRDHKSSDQLDKSSVLFCAYCLSEDQHWLLAVCTDAVGELMEHACINIRIPDRHRRKRASARRVGLSKLWDFIIGIISETCCPWRLVVQRMGRIGHRELTAWNGLLGKKNLARTTALLRENCRLCTKLHAGGGGGGGANGGSCSSAQHDLPSLVSACLVSMEPQSTFRVWPQLVCTTEERMSSNLPLVTPRDTSVTHILVFPTSAMAQCQSNASGMGMGMGIMGSMDGDMFEGLDIEGIPDGIDGMDFDFSDQEIMSYELAAANGPNSPTGMNHMIGGVGGPADMHNKEGNGSAEGPGGPVDPQDDMTNTLMQQPLAMGFYLSTAPAGPLPSWFWSTCPQACVLCPAIFKAALHVNTFSVTDDVGVQTGKERVAHPLDSSLTTDVLRFVLESYNSLSWLTIDPVTNDRRSCLPVHILYLTHLSNAQFAFI